MTTLASAGSGLASRPIIGFVNPAGLDARLIPIPFRVGETIRAEAFHISGRFWVEQRFDEQAADAAGTGNTVRVAATCHDEAFHLAALANDEAAIGRERRPAFADEILF